MSDTPMTSALLGAILERDGELCERNAPKAWVQLCKSLERQRTASEALKVCQIDNQRLITALENLIEAIPLIERSAYAEVIKNARVVLASGPVYAVAQGREDLVSRETLITIPKRHGKEVWS